MSISAVTCLTCLSGERGTAELWESTVQPGISTFVSVTPVDIFNNMFQLFTAVFLTRYQDNLESKIGYFLIQHQDIFCSCLQGRDSPWTPTEWFVCLNLSRLQHNNVHYQHLFRRWRGPLWIIVSKLSKMLLPVSTRRQKVAGRGGAASQWYPTLVPIQRSGLLFYFFSLPCLPLCRCQSFISGSLSFTSPQDISSLLLLSLSHCFSSFWPTPRQSDAWTPPTCPSPRACLLLQGCKRSTLCFLVIL